MPDLWNEAIGRPRIFCRDLFGPAADTLPRTYNLSTVLRPGPRPPDSKLVRRRLLRSKTWAGHFFALSLRRPHDPCASPMSRVRSQRSFFRFCSVRRSLAESYDMEALEGDAAPTIAYHGRQNSTSRVASRVRLVVRKPFKRRLRSRDLLENRDANFTHCWKNLCGFPLQGPPAPPVRSGLRRARCFPLAVDGALRLRPVRAVCG